MLRVKSIMSDFIKSKGSRLLWKEEEKKWWLEEAVNLESFRLQIRAQSKASSGTKSFSLENLCMIIQGRVYLSSVGSKLLKSAIYYVYL